MAVIILELHGIKRGAVLPRRVLIGRRSMNHLVIDDTGVSRMHAWIDREGDRYYINDTGSRTGTRVNGQRIERWHLLGDEDEINIGPAKLTFLAESRLHSGIEPFDLDSSLVASMETGIPFDCPSCLAPLWASRSFAGRTGQCKYCGRYLVAPRSTPPSGNGVSNRDVSAAKALIPTKCPADSTSTKPVELTAATVTGSPFQADDSAALLDSGRRDLGTEYAAAPMAEARLAPEVAPARRINGAPVAATVSSVLIEAPSSTGHVHANPLPGRRRLGKDEKSCGVCQSVIAAYEEQCACPKCGLVFHSECWEENYGCSAYGCPQVNALMQPGQQADQNHNGASLAGAALAGGHAAAGEPGNGKVELEATPYDAPARFPWEFLLLAGSVFSALVGALTFGLPSLALAGGTVTYIARHRGKGDAHRGIILLSAGLGLLGVIAGVPVSWFLYFGGGHAYVPTR